MVAGLMAVMASIHTVYLQGRGHVAAVRPVGRHGSLVRGPEEAVAGEEGHHEDDGRKPAWCQRERDHFASRQEATV